MGILRPGTEARDGPTLGAAAKLERLQSWRDALLAQTALLLNC